MAHPCVNAIFIIVPSYPAMSPVPFEITIDVCFCVCVLFLFLVLDCIRGQNVVGQCSLDNLCVPSIGNPPGNRQDVGLSIFDYFVVVL